MPSDAERAIAVSSSNSIQTASEQDERRQPMEIYRPPATPLPGNRPVADNTTEDTDDMLGYLD